MEEPQAVLSQVGGAIRAARESSGLNLHELARLSGISAPALSRIETGKRDLRVSSLFRIAAALRIEPRTLISGQTDQSRQPGDANQGYDLADYI